MKTDAEVLLVRRERAKGKTQEQAAARAGMSVRTVRKYEQLGSLPSQLKEPRRHRTRPDPFAADWDWLQEQLARDPALQATTLFGALCERRPGVYAVGQLRTLQRHVAAWRVRSGPEQEVVFPQEHRAGEAAQSDFTHMAALGVMLGGGAFPHLLFHLVLPYSNVEAVHICPSESFEALAEGLEACLWQLGGVPRRHRTDHLAAALRPLEADGRARATARYEALLAHYELTVSTSHVGAPAQNGDVEQSHRRFKEAVDQALRLRGSRDFADRASYEHFLAELVRRRNLTRRARWEQERVALRPLPAAPLAPCRELRVRVGRFSTIRVLGNTYSVPSRLIGTTVTVRVRAETLQLYQGSTHLLSLPRLVGQGGARIDYRHLAWSLVRKPGAFARYRHRDELFPTLNFRRAYDALLARDPARADGDYVRLLHLAASTTQTAVDTALARLLEQGSPPTFEAPRQLVRPSQPTELSARAAETPDLTLYDRLVGVGW